MSPKMVVDCVTESNDKYTIYKQRWTKNDTILSLFCAKYIDSNDDTKKYFAFESIEELSKLEEEIKNIIVNENLIFY